MPKSRVRVFVEGLVQGVNFRYYTQQRAKQNNIFGWVRNLPDGRVEAVFEGDDEAVESMIDFCQSGPSSSKVTDVVVKREEWKGEFRDFSVRH